ncbi:hypothetical protein EJB05_30351, partial [Eragrostis curvula]
MRALARQTMATSAATRPTRHRGRNTNTVGVVPTDAGRPAAENHFTLAGWRHERARSEQQISSAASAVAGAGSSSSSHTSKRPRRGHGDDRESNRNNNQKDGRQAEGRARRQTPLMATSGSCSAAPSAGHPPICPAGAAGMVRPRLVLFGDSITEQSFRPGGWGAALADTYSRKRLQRLQHTRGSLLDPSHFSPGCLAPPLAKTIFFGANDAALLGRTSERQHVPISRLFEVHVNLLITPPPVDEEGRERFARTNEMAGVYAGQCIEPPGNAYTLHYIWSKMQETDGWQETLPK